MKITEDIRAMAASGDVALPTSAAEVQAHTNGKPEKPLVQLQVTKS